MKAVTKSLGASVIVALVVASGGALWARSVVSTALEQAFDVHEVEFPIPFPLSEAELTALRNERAEAIDGQPRDDGTPAAGPGGEAKAEQETDKAPPDGDPVKPAGEVAMADPLATVDLAEIATERAIERGKHLVEARYACVTCHGQDFGGGVMIDDPAMGTLLGPNLTSGKGGVVAEYTAADWDRIVRHGVKPDMRPSFMPAEDFQLMSDQELSDIIVYLRSATPVDKEVAAPNLGPLGTILSAFGKLPFAASLIEDHHSAHQRLPPTSGPTADFGKHLAGVCIGCHRSDLSGGPVAAGPPDWPPASNLTPHEQGLPKWTYEQFVRSMREGARRDGTPFREPMSLLTPYARNMTETELKALWAYISSVPPKPTI